MRHPTYFVLLAALVSSSSLACGREHHYAARYPARANGCDVQIFEDAPPGPTDNIGPVSASCAETLEDADCVRTLKDQVCALGGDVVWGVGQPKNRHGKNYWKGRAAHTKSAAFPAATTVAAPGAPAP